jgi:hypothetical protein
MIDCHVSWKNVLNNFFLFYKLGSSEVFDALIHTELEKGS